MSRFLTLVLVLNLLSATLFISFVNRPVYDDAYNLVDVHTYATQGLSMDTLRMHRNSPGPTSFLWMAGAVRLLGDNELRDARIGVLVSWILLAAGILLGAKHSSSPQLWYGALLTLLVFPHAVEATATVLTEGPALLFATLGALAWIEFASRPNITPGLFVAGMLGGLSLGLAVTSRQYNLALLAAAGLFAVLQYRKRLPDEKLRWSAGIAISLALAAISIFLMVYIWRGISSPGMAAGTSYQNWQAGVGTNLFRPLVGLFYVGVYLVPLTCPVIQHLKSPIRWRAILVAALGAIFATFLRASLLQPGPLNTLVQGASRVPKGDMVLFGFIAGVTTLNAIALAQWLWIERDKVFSNSLSVFAALTILFFIAEQAGVGGNLPFYDRYVLQIAPFLGIISFSVLPQLTYPRIAALAALSVVSHFLLWRYAFGFVISP